MRDILTYGNFSEEQVNKLEAMKAELYSDETDLRAMRSDDELQKMIESVKLQIKDNDVSRQFIKYLIAAANEYAVKRAEIMLTPLKMKQASIKLFEVVKSTGELKVLLNLHMTAKIIAGCLHLNALKQAWRLQIS